MRFENKYQAPILNDCDSPLWSTGPDQPEPGTRYLGLRHWLGPSKRDPGNAVLRGTVLSFRGIAMELAQQALAVLRDHLG